ncbi:hypothetical protein BHM03_00018653 [Ensete ventricosum]|uniref:Uncharacterized protein n=1 Tax=Ensete ventricosum TaxID=4639 RepID=A0A445MFF3_ENSVE|nr:hypothetical protein BHM03_00018653 [Ensete ventricosum]
MTCPMTARLSPLTEKRDPNDGDVVNNDSLLNSCCLGLCSCVLGIVVSTRDSRRNRLRGTQFVYVEDDSSSGGVAAVCGYAVDCLVSYQVVPYLDVRLPWRFNPYGYRMVIGDEKEAPYWYGNGGTFLELVGWTGRRSLPPKAKQEVGDRLLPFFSLR